MPDDAGFGPIEPFLVKTVLLRGEQYMGQRPVTAPAKVADRRTLRARSDSSDVAQGTHLARLVRYVGRANRPCAVLVMLTYGTRVAGIYENTQPGGKEFLKQAVGMCVAMNADAACMFLNEAAGGPEVYNKIADTLSEVLEMLDVRLIQGGIVGRTSWLSAQTQAEHEYGGETVGRGGR